MCARGFPLDGGQHAVELIAQVPERVPLPDSG
jgi:hypothetical protein